MARTVMVIGHKNPDTDSICSAISYAYLKNKINKDKEVVYEAKRAGHINGETAYVLDHFKAELPEYVPDVATQVKNIEIRKTPGVDRTISLKKAWMMMKELDVVTLPVVRSGRLEGIITTERIAQSYMDVYDNEILSRAHTKISNIAETLDGEVVVGNPEEYYIHGKVIVGAAHKWYLEGEINKGDFVILANRTQSQLLAVKSGAGVLAVCNNSELEDEVINLAKENDCTIIVSPHDAYTVARLVNQSMPISYFMHTRNIVTFKTEDYLDDIKEIMAKQRYRDFPIVDNHGMYVGMISRRNLLGARKKQLILVDHNEGAQAVDNISDAEILEIIDHHRLGSVETVSPVFFRNQPLGCCATIIKQMFNEQGVKIPKKIAGLLLSAIISDTLMFRSPTCTEIDKSAAEDLAKIAGCDIEKLATDMFTAGSNLKSKTAEAIFYQDYKQFTIDGVKFGIGQICSMSEEELDAVKNRMHDYIDKISKGSGLDAMYFMLTNILTEDTKLLYAGSKAEDLIERGYEIKSDGDTFLLEGIVSRKKQLLPQIMLAIKEEI
ncbi:putative manganese-dependent inorganic diphosphatase [Eubacterium sp.]|uniref:putative manganese-dependent inorganic diphosphatase n=1 Tax=Eubacterium sp. TaxID=142586 RepID=UPI0025F4DD5A|nr:putative manganese-dependent inorganic diphosphatase [Eubacterium sp.]MCR5630069.1 putative manganese-dependent inorganic diphosphatase [Eubacterium sp.]